MGDLIIELSLAFLAATLIGWLTGRFLCKSGEYDERAEKRRLATELASTVKELEASRQTADGLRRQLGEQTETAALVEQEKSGLRIRLDAMEGALEKRLCEVQALEVCHARIRGLEVELEDRQGQVLELRSTCTIQADRIGTLDANLEEMRQALRESHAETRRKQVEIDRGLAEITRLRERQAENDAGILTLQQQTRTWSSSCAG